MFHDHAQFTGVCISCPRVRSHSYKVESRDYDFYLRDILLRDDMLSNIFHDEAEEVLLTAGSGWHFSLQESFGSACDIILVDKLFGHIVTCTVHSSFA